jgi:hypothetical protein
VRVSLILHGDEMFWFCVLSAQQGFASRHPCARGSFRGASLARAPQPGGCAGVSLFNLPWGRAWELLWSRASLARAPQPGGCAGVSVPGASKALLYIGAGSWRQAVELRAYSS